MKKCLIWVALLAMLLCAVPFTATAAEDDSVAVVLLMDVSASMERAPGREAGTGADPMENGTRTSIEAAQQFAFNYPSNVALYIKVIPYNAAVYNGFDFENVSTEAGMRDYKRNVEAILNDTVSGYDFWDDNKADVTTPTGTDIGAALETAQQELASQEAAKKAVILFTDGKIKLQRGEGEVDPNTVSADKAIASAEALAEADIPLYGVILENPMMTAAEREQELDPDFIDSLTDEEVAIAAEASDLNEVFQRIYTYLFENSMLDQSGGEDETIHLVEGIEAEKTLKIYDQAVREVNISLISGKKLKSIAITTPDDEKVANVNLETGVPNRVDENCCVINQSTSLHTVNIKLLRPQGGDWKITIEGETNPVMVSTIYLFDLELRDNITTNALYFKETFHCESTIYNAETGVALPANDLYAEAKATVTVTNTDTEDSFKVRGTLNSGSNGYDYDINFREPGSYRLNFVVTHDKFEVKSTKDVEVTGPTLDVAVDETAENLSIAFVNPSSGERFGEVPSYLEDGEGDVVIRLGEEIVHEEEIDADDFENGEYTLSLPALTSGDYAVTVTLKDGSEKLEAEATVTVAASTISVSEDAVENKIQKTGFNADYEESISIKKLFKDSDGDELEYSVVTDNEDVAEAEIDGTRLKITTKDFGSAKVTVKATDGKGAEAVYEITVTVKSIRGLVIGGIIALVVIIAAVVVFLIIVNKRKVIRFAFRVKIARSDEEKYSEAVYNVGRLASNRRAKGTMSLETLLSSMNSFADLLNSNFAGDGELDAIVESLGCVTVSGMPFKRAFKVMLNGKKKGTFTRNMIRVDVPSSGCTVIFGSVNDFEPEEEETYGF